MRLLTCLTRQSSHFFKCVYKAIFAQSSEELHVGCLGGGALMVCFCDQLTCRWQIRLISGSGDAETSCVFLRQPHLFSTFVRTSSYVPSTCALSITPCCSPVTALTQIHSCLKPFRNTWATNKLPVCPLQHCPVCSQTCKGEGFFCLSDWQGLRSPGRWLLSTQNFKGYVFGHQWSSVELRSCSGLCISIACCHVWFNAQRETELQEGMWQKIHRVVWPYRGLMSPDGNQERGYKGLYRDRRFPAWL